MSFTVRIGADLLSVEAGSTVPLAFEVANRSDSPDTFEVAVEGIDPEWVSIPIPTFTVDPREIESKQILFKPPRVSESLAGTYPFVLKVRSLESGEVRTGQGVVTIQPYHYLSMEVGPRRAVHKPFGSPATFRVTVMNLGNTEHTIRLMATEPDDALAFDFAEDTVVLGPGQTKTVDFLPRLAVRRPISSARLYVFGVNARSVENPSVHASAQAQLEERPLITPGWLMMFVLLAILVGAWWALLPKPPSIDMTISSAEPERGQEVIVRWRASGNTRTVQIKVNDQVVADDLAQEGSIEFVAQQSGIVEAVAIRDGNRSIPVVRPFSVKEPTVAPTPEILGFSIEPRTVNVGKQVLVTYRLGESVTKATLSPPGMQLDLKINRINIEPEVPGTIEYTLVAENAQGKTVRRSVKVQVVDASDAAIIDLSAKPRSVPFPSGSVSVVYQVSNAVRIELRHGEQVYELVGERGETTLMLDQPTTLVLTAFDSRGRTVTRNLRLEQDKPPTDPVPPVIEPEPSLGPPSGP